MKSFVLLLLTIFLVFAIPSGYAGGGHGSGGHSGGHSSGRHHGGHGSGHGSGGHSGGHSSGRHHGGHGSLYIGYSGYYPAPYYYYPSYYPARLVVTEPATQTIYVEKSAQAEPYYWYYCTDPKGYYPHVERCPTGWLQVVPRSPQD